MPVLVLSVGCSILGKTFKHQFPQQEFVWFEIHTKISVKQNSIQINAGITKKSSRQGIVLSLSPKRV